MPYCTQTDIEEQLSPAELIQLTDDAGAGTLDSTVLARAIADADAEIDAYLYQNYSTPLSSVPAIVRKLSVDIAIYHLCSRRPVGMPDIRKARYDLALKMLKDISTGLISIGALPPTLPGDGPKSTGARDDRIFTIGKSSSGSIGTLDNF